MVKYAILRGREPLFGCRGFSPEEIRRVEEEWGRPLPLAYRAFLAVMGRRAGWAFGDVRMSFDGPEALMDFQGDARELIAECDVAHRIPAGAFFCSNYLNSQLSYFDADLGEEDPQLFDLEAGNPEDQDPISKHTISSYIHDIFQIINR